MIFALLALSIALQLTAAFVALRLVSLTRRKAPWRLLSATIVLMAARRISTFFHMWFSGDRGGDLLPETVALAVSALLLLALLRLRPMLAEMNESREESRRSESRLRQVIDLIPSMVLARDKGGRLILANKAAASFYGMKPEEIEGRLQGDIHPDKNEWQQVLRGDREVLETSKPVRAQPMRLTPPDGDPRLFTASKIPFEAQEGEAVLCVATDVTEETRAREALRRSEAEKSLVLQSVSDGVIYQDSDRRILWANRVVEGWLGVEEGALVGRRCHDLFHGNTEICENCTAKATLEGGTERTEEIALPNGRTIFLVGNPVFDGDGRVVGLAQVARDVTEQREARRRLEAAYHEMESKVADRTRELAASNESLRREVAVRRGTEEALGESLRFMEAMLASIPTPVFYKDTEGRYLGCNRAFEELMGRTQAQIRGRRVEELWPLPHATLYEQKDREMLEAGGDQVYQTVIRSADGSERQVIVSKSPFSHANGKTAGLIGSVVDITDRQRAREAVREGERRLRLVMEASSDGVWDYNLKTGELYLSPSWFTMLGYEPDAMEQRLETWEALVHPDDRERTLEALERHIRGETTHFRSEFRLRGAKGEWFWILSRGQAIEWDDEGRTVRVAGAHTDVTKVRRAGETLRRFRTALDKSGDAILIVDYASLRILDVNRTACRLLGYSREEFLRLTASEVRHATSQDRIREEYDRVFAEPDRCDYIETLYRRRDDSTVPIEVLLSGMESEGRRLVIAASRDISERRRAEQALRRSQERLELTLKGADLASWDWNVETGFVVYNERFAEMLGCRPDGIRPVYHEWESRIHPDDRDGVLEHLESHMEGRTPFYRSEHRLRRSSGDYLWTLSAGKVVERDEKGRATRVVGTLLDISHRKEFEHLLIEAKNAAEAASRAKSAFLANMSHELRTPLNAVIGFSDLLGQEVAGPMNHRQREFVRTIADSGKHLLDLIDDILDLAKVEAGRISFHPTWVDLGALLSASPMMVKSRALKRGIELRCEAGEVGRIVADEKMVKQIVYNLLSNAVKFTAKGGRVTVSARRDKDHVIVSVEDTGIGIAPAEQEKIFEEFYQVEDSYTRRFEGTGLGLALSRKLAEMHSGRLWVESRPGEGSVFHLMLPTGGDTQAGDPRDASPEAAPIEPESATVLLVEDDEVNRRLVREALRNTPLRVIEADRGEIGYGKALAEQPDIVLLDIQLPDIDGLTLARRLRETPETRDLPVIALTACAMEGDRERILEAGCDDYLAKPIGMKELAQTLARRVKGRHGASRRPQARASANSGPLKEKTL